MKLGNAVKLMHTFGLRGRMEITGHGEFIPTPVEGDTWPTTVTGTDAVLSGCNVVPLDPPALYVGVTAGTYRIDDVIYYLGALGGVAGPMPLNDAPPMEMGDAVPMGTMIAWGLAIDPPSATKFRYDLIVAGTDSIAHVVKGDEADEPVMPDCPEDHVSLGWILLHPGTYTEITSDMINREWTEPEPASIEISVAVTNIAGPPHVIWADVSYDVKDQYGNDISAPFGEHYTLSFYYPLFGDESQTEEDMQTAAMTGGSYDVRYIMDVDPPDRLDLIAWCTIDVEPAPIGIGYFPLWPIV